MNSQTDSPSDPSTASTRVEFSGRAIAIGMLVLGVAATAFLYIYWDLHTRPFRPLTEAIDAEFKGSLPRVEGGRQKRGPSLLRIAIRVDFDPNEDDGRFHEVVDRLLELARGHQDLTPYEKLEIHLINVRPEAASPTRKFSKPIEKL